MNNHSNENGNAFDSMMLTLGQTLALEAVKQADEATTNWNKIKTVLSLVRGKEKEALDRLFEPGEKMPQRKAPWYRKQKRILRQALEYNIDFTNLSMRETELAIAATRASRRTKREAKDDALRMMQRTFKGALERTGDKEVLAAIERLMPAVSKKPPAKKRVASARR